MEVEFYESADGKVPVREFLDSVSIGMRAKAIWSIEFLRSMGRFAREPYSKSLEDGIFELRIRSGSDISRILYFFFVGDKAVLTHGFIKKTQKTPRSEIEKAKRLMADYIRRKA